MALESATYIDDLNPTFPASTDLLAQGDDHIRLIKSVLQATFPNITGPITVDQDDINSVIALLAGGGGSLVPIGAITAWYGASGTVPAGWHVCDGTLAVARSDGAGTIDTPDLRNLVIMGAGTVAAQGTAYGAANDTATTAASGAHSHSTAAGEGGHTHSGTSVAPHALTISEIPAHTHTVPYSDSGSAGSCIENAAGTAVANATSGSTGGGAAHSHDIAWPVTPDGVHTHTTDTVAAHAHGVTVSTYQPAMALHYIMKI